MKADHDHRDRLYLTINLLFLGMLLNPKSPERPRMCVTPPWSLWQQSFCKMSGVLGGASGHGP